MGNRFIPSVQDVARYRALRSLGMELTHKIVKTIPSRAFDDIGATLGLLRDGVLVFESMELSSVMMDCCLYDWFENGVNVVQRYARAHPAKPGSGEEYLLAAYLQAKYRILVTDSPVAGAGIHCRDILNGEDLFLMDVGLSGVDGATPSAFATRTIPLGEYCMTGGAGLPISSKDSVLEALSGIDTGEHRSLEGPGAVPLVIVRSCLRAGAAANLRYQDIEAAPAARPRRRIFPSIVKRRRK